MHKKLFDVPDRFETEKLILRPYQDGDEVTFLEMLNNDNRKYLDELLGTISQAIDLNQIKMYLRQLKSDWTAKNRFVLSYWLKNSSEYLGHIWIEPKNWDLLIFEIGWFVVKNQQGKGFATEAAKIAIGFLFNNLKAKKITANVRDHGKYKEKSIRIVKRCGFKQEGYSRESVQISNSKGSGPIVGVYHYGLLRSEALDEGFLTKND